MYDNTEWFMRATFFHSTMFLSMCWCGVLGDKTIEKSESIALRFSILLSLAESGSFLRAHTNTHTRRYSPHMLHTRQRVNNAIYCSEWEFRREFSGKSINNNKISELRFLPAFCRSLSQNVAKVCFETTRKKILQSVLA